MKLYHIYHSVQHMQIIKNRWNYYNLLLKIEHILGIKLFLYRSVLHFGIQ